MSDDYQKLVDMFEGRGKGPAGWTSAGRGAAPVLRLAQRGRLSGAIRRVGRDRPAVLGGGLALLQWLYEEYQEAKSQGSGRSR